MESSRSAFAKHLSAVLCLIVAIAKETDPICGKSAYQVARWQQGLQNVGALAFGAPELRYYEKVQPLRRSPVLMHDTKDYKHLDKKVQDAKVLQQSNMERGTREKVLVEISDGWLLPNGFAINRTHRFDLGVLNERFCLQSGLAGNLGRKACKLKPARIWSDLLDGEILPWEYWLEGPFSPPSEDDLMTWKLKCTTLDSVVGVAIESAYADHNCFMVEALTRLSWPSVQELENSSALWRFRDEGYLSPWLNLLGLSHRKFVTLQPRVAIKFKKLHLALRIGMDEEFTDKADELSFAPQSDILGMRTMALKAVRGVRPTHHIISDTASWTLILERHKIRRSFSSSNVDRLRQAVSSHFQDHTGTRVASVQGTDAGGFKINLLQSDSSWLPLTLAEGLLIFSRAVVMIGVHGSLLNHMVVSPPGANVIEFVNSDHIELYYYSLAAKLDLNYYSVITHGNHNVEEIPLANSQFTALDGILGKIASSIAGSSGKTTMKADEL